MQSFVVFHPGTQHSWQTALALQQLDALEFYATSIFYKPDEWPYRIEALLPARLKASVHAEFRRFRNDALQPERVRTAGILEWVERLVRRAGHRRLANRIDAFGNSRFAASLSATVGSNASFGLWGYDNSSRDLFKVAKQRGRTCVLDRTNGDWRAYNATMAQVYQDFPEFFLDPAYAVAQERIDRNEEEYALADAIVVGSEFAAHTVRRFSSTPGVADRIRVLNYCYDERLFGQQPAPSPGDRTAPLRFLFVGQAGVRKGIHLVLQAFEKIPRSAAELTIVGDLQVPPAIFARYADRVNYQRTVPRADIPALMAASDILLFPSYFEGSALSLIEGLASGLAIIQSPNAGCGVTPETGLLLKEQSVDELHAAIMYAVENRDTVDSWRAHAQAEAARYSFQNYRENIRQLITGLSVVPGVAA